MFAGKPHLGRRPRVLSSAGVFLGGVAALLGAAGCAGHHHISEAPPHPIAVEINNNLTVPTELTVFITQDQGGIRQMLGTVPGAQTKTFTFTPVAWATTYRLLGDRPLGGPVRSPAFTVDDPSTGTISWNVIPNQVEFYDMQQADTTKPPATTTSH
jgi:hypothetical protein